MPASPASGIRRSHQGQAAACPAGVLLGLELAGAAHRARRDLTPWSTRFFGYCIGAATLVVLLKLQGRSFHIPFGRNWIHVFIAGMLNVVAFGLFGTFAQLSTATTRVIIINYSMPIWASILAWLILRERPERLGRRRPRALHRRARACWSIRSPRRRCRSRPG